MTMERTRIDAGTVSFSIGYYSRDGGVAHGTAPGARGGQNPDQGLSLQVRGEVDGEDTELLRFDCFEIAPHYHYAPARENTQVMLDPVVTGNPIGWAFEQISTRLPAMLTKAGYPEVATRVNAVALMEALPEAEATARHIAATRRATVTHSRGKEIVEAGNIRFGLEIRRTTGGGGPAIHVLGDVAGQEIELLAFDCFYTAPHYHYGPRSRNERIYWDSTLVEDPLAWTIDRFREGALPRMLQRAGYHRCRSRPARGLCEVELYRVVAAQLGQRVAGAGGSGSCGLTCADPRTGRVSEASSEALLISLKI